MKRKITKLLTSLLFIVSMVSVTGCSKDEYVSYGELKLSFSNFPSDLEVWIFSIENDQTPIYQFSPISRESTLILNIGNYILQPVSTTYFPKVGFQIKNDNRTVIVYDPRNVGSVTEF